MDHPDNRSTTGSLSRRRFLNGAVAGVGALALADRMAFAQSMAGKPALRVEDIQGWGHEAGVVDIGDNENPFGPSPRAVRAVADGMMDVNRYDFSSDRELAEAIAHYHGMPASPPARNRFANSPQPIQVEGGSSHILRLVAQHFGVRHGTGEIIEAELGYGGVSRFIERFRDRVGAEVTVKRVPTTGDFQHDLDGMLEAVTEQTTLVVITNPNNPTGTIVPQADIERFVRSVPDSVIVLIDEAYIHFVREPGYGDSIALARKYPNVVVTRTFSKIFGLAGLRVGYAIADKSVTDELRFYGNSDGIGSINCYAAATALEDDAFVRHVRRLTDQSKDYFYGELEKLGLSYTPSHSSFVLVNAGTDGAALVERMAAGNVLLSRLGMNGLPRMNNYVRFSIGTMDEMQVAVATLRQELAA